MLKRLWLASKFSLLQSSEDKDAELMGLVDEEKERLARDPEKAISDVASGPRSRHLPGASRQGQAKRESAEGLHRLT